jgi:peptidoglycan/xylan/chitin deacetylase (PgdA/CDA1 family)
MSPLRRFVTGPPRGHLAIDLPLLSLAAALWPLAGAWALLGAAGLAVALHARAVTDRRSSLYHRVHWRVPPTSPAVALTFDDGPDPATTPVILDLLSAARCTATFFPIGANAAAHPALVRRICAEGHALGLHTQTHPYTYPLLPPARQRSELAANAAILTRLVGTAPRLFRPPMGISTPLVASAAAGLVTVTWGVSGRDTRTVDPAAIRRRVGRGLRPGAIILLHDGAAPRHPGDRSATAAALPGILADLAAAGLTSRALVVDGDVPVLKVAA